MKVLPYESIPVILPDRLSKSSSKHRFSQTINNRNYKVIKNENNIVVKPLPKELTELFTFQFYKGIEIIISLRSEHDQYFCKIKMNPIYKIVFIPGFFIISLISVVVGFDDPIFGAMFFGAVLFISGVQYLVFSTAIKHLRKTMVKELPYIIERCDEVLAKLK